MPIDLTTLSRQTITEDLGKSQRRGQESKEQRDCVESAGVVGFSSACSRVPAKHTYKSYIRQRDWSFFDES